jgi:hypothetical protein
MLRLLELIVLADGRLANMDAIRVVEPLICPHAREIPY